LSPIEPAVPDAPVGGPGLQLTFTTTPSPIGQYSPLNCTAVWIERDEMFVKTIDRRCAVRTQYLLAWNLASGGDEDAVTGASRTGHQMPVSLTWDLTDRSGAVVPDGEYTIRLESTENNSTSVFQNNQGGFTFVKGSPVTKSGLDHGGFVDVSFTYTPP
jgi:hypothetical protein